MGVSIHLVPDLRCTVQRWENPCDNKGVADTFWTHQHVATGHTRRSLPSHGSNPAACVASQQISPKKSDLWDLGPLFRAIWRDRRGRTHKPGSMLTHIFWLTLDGCLADAMVKNLLDNSDGRFIGGLLDDSALRPFHQCMERIHMPCAHFPLVRLHACSCILTGHRMKGTPALPRFALKRQ
jgi:hypothetical protein